MRISASILGRTRNSMGEIPMVDSASISWLVFIVPSCAAKAAAVPPRHDDGGHDAADLTRHRDGHQVRHEDRCAELLELDRADEREDEPDQEADQAHDAERARPAVLDDDEQVARSKPRPAAE